MMVNKYEVMTNAQINQEIAKRLGYQVKETGDSHVPYEVVDSDGRNITYGNTVDRAWERLLFSKGAQWATDLVAAIKLLDDARKQRDSNGHVTFFAIHIGGQVTRVPDWVKHEELWKYQKMVGTEGGDLARATAITWLYWHDEFNTTQR